MSVPSFVRPEEFTTPLASWRGGPLQEEAGGLEGNSPPKKRPTIKNTKSENINSWSVVGKLYKFIGGIEGLASSHGAFRLVGNKLLARCCCHHSCRHCCCHHSCCHRCRHYHHQQCGCLRLAVAGPTLLIASYDFWYFPYFGLVFI